MEAGIAGGDEVSPAMTISRWSFRVSQLYQHVLDKSTLHMLQRWIAFLVVAAVYVIRVYLVQGFYIISYSFGIF